MKKKLVIVYTIGSFMLGGAEAQLLMLATGMRRLGHEVHVFVISDVGPLRKSFIDAGISTHHGGCSLKGHRFARMARLVRAEFCLIELLRRLKPDVVHNFLPLTNLMGAVAGRLTGRPLVITSRRALGTHQDRVAFWKPMDRVANALSHVITANSRAVAEDVMRRDGADRSKIRVIYNGIDIPDVLPDLAQAVRDELGIRPTSLAVICVANLIPYKGHREIIVAMKRVVCMFPDIRLILVGEDRGIGANLDYLVREMGIEGHVQRIGQRRDVSRLLSGMDVGILASHEEGFSNALLEMLGAGLPVIATRVGGNAEVLEGMPGCTLVEPNSPSEIEAALISTFTRIEDARSEAAVRCSTIKMAYSKRAMLDEYGKLYQKPRL
ncbi:glycosyltransferase [Rhizobium sp. SIMBA_035]|jgi:glycosyltransferase involved in cell wall biosynthesis